MQNQTLASQKIGNNTTFQTLKNGVKYCVAVFPDSSKAAISVSINRGHLHATDYPEGFAHLLEHMLFNPSNRYQKTNDLDQHLAEYNGQVNGWTQDLMTNFQLSCDPHGFAKACDILLDRLIQPLFSLEHIEREITAIDAEFKLKQSDPIRQLLSVHKATCSPHHPFSKFSTGNQKTLGKNNLEHTQTLLKTFHQDTMLGHNICICLAVPDSQITSDDMDAICAQIETGFQSRKGKKQQPHVLSNFYLDSQLNTLIQLKGQQHQLMVSFVLNQIDQNISDSLLVLLTHLIESKHALGLHDTLISRNWVHDLYSYYKRLDDHTFELIVGVNLNNEGAEAHTQVTELILAYMQFLKHEGIEKWRFREKASQYNLQSQLHAKAGALEFAVSLSQKMHNTEFEHILKPDTFAIEDAYSMLPNVVSQLNNAHSRVYFISPNAQTDKTSAHYNTPYSIRSRIHDSKARLAKLPTFAKPRQNPFMSGEHQMITAELESNELVQFSSPQLCLKFYQDIRFHLPNGECYISITDPCMFQNTQEIAIKRVWLSCLNEYLANRFFDVELASLHYRVYPHHHGISIHTSGFSERQLLLCIELINAIKQFKARPESIKRHLHQCVSRASSNLAQKPFNQLFSQLNELYSPKASSALAITSALQALTVDDVLLKQTAYFSHNYVESLILGNWTLEATERFFTQLTTRFCAFESFSKPKAPKQAMQSSVHKHTCMPNLSEANMIWHIVPTLNKQESSLALAARSLLLEKLLSPIVFEVLRQQHKMGYMLGVGYKPIGGFPGIAMYLLSPTHSLEDIRKAMLESVDTALAIINDAPEMLAQLKNGLIAQVSPKESEIGQTATRAWLHFDDENPLLAYQDLLHAIENTQHSELVSCLQSMLCSSRGQVLYTQSAFESHVFELFEPF